MSFSPDEAYQDGIARLARKDSGGARISFNKAIEEWTRIIDANPKVAGAYSNRGLAKAMIGDVAGSIQDYTVGLSLAPGDAVLHANLGWALGQSGKLEEARIEHTRAIELDPTLITAYSGRADAVTRILKTDPSNLAKFSALAEADLKKALALSAPDDPQRESLKLRLLAMQEILRRSRPKAGCALMVVLVLLASTALWIPSPPHASKPLSPEVKGRPEGFDHPFPVQAGQGWKGTPFNAPPSGGG
jgi:tetratricopeptide (TPR) repeat protein